MPFDSSVAQSQDRAGAAEAAAGSVSRMHEEVAHERSGAVVRITVKQGDSIRSIGRELYLANKGRLPSDQELKEFENDTAKRSGLKTKEQRDHVHVNAALVVKVPTREVKVAAAHKTIAETPKIAQTPKIAVPIQHGKPLQHSSADRHEAGAPVCSGADLNMIAHWISHNEAGPQAYTAFNPNDQGHGISVGLMQWNQKRGKLPDLLQAWHRKNPSKFDNMFGSFSDDLMKTNYVKGADFNHGRLKQGMDRALGDGEFQQVQLALRNEHIEDSCEMAKDYSFTSLRGRAIVADLSNQLGPGGTRKILAKVPDAKNESVRIERLKHISDGRINGGDRVTAIEEKVKEIWRKGG